MLSDAEIQGTVARRVVVAINCLIESYDKAAIGYLRLTGCACLHVARRMAFLRHLERLLIHHAPYPEDKRQTDAGEYRLEESVYRFNRDSLPCYIHDPLLPGFCHFCLLEYTHRKTS